MNNKVNLEKKLEIRLFYKFELSKQFNEFKLEKRCRSLGSLNEYYFNINNNINNLNFCQYF